MPRLSLRMHNSSAVESESSYGSSTVVSKAHRLPLLPLSPQQSPTPVSPPPKQSSQSNGRSRMKLAQSNGHVHFQSFRKEEEEDDDHEDETSAKKEVGAGDDDDDDDEELYLDAVDHLLHSPEDDLRKVSGSEDIASSSSSNVTTTTYVNKDTSVSGDCGGGGSRASAGADGSVQQQSYDNDEDDSLKMEVDDRFEQAVVGALPSPPERHSTLKKQHPSSDLGDSTDSAKQLSRRRLRFSVRTFSEGVDPVKAALQSTISSAASHHLNTPTSSSSSVVFHPVPPFPAIPIQSSYRTDSLATIANLPTTTAQNQSTSTPTSSSSSTKNRRPPLSSRAIVTSDSSLQSVHTPAKNVQFPVSLLKGATATTEHSFTVHGKPPLRPSILKASTPFVFGGHRRTCPRSRNMSGDAIHSSKGSISSTTSNDHRRWRLFGGHSVDEPSCKGGHRGSHRHQAAEHSTEEEHSPFFDASTDLTDSFDMGAAAAPALEPCTCHLDSAATPPAKSVHILTPTKSEEILFDPAQSVANSIISINKLHHSSHHHHRHHSAHGNSKQHNNRQQQQQQNDNNNIRAGNEFMRNLAMQTNGCSPATSAAAADAVSASAPVRSDDYKDSPMAAPYMNDDDEEQISSSSFSAHANNSQHSHKSEPSNCSSELTEMSFLDEEEEHHEDVKEDDNEDNQSPYKDTVISIDSLNHRVKKSSSCDEDDTFLNFKSHPSEARLINNDTYNFQKEEGGVEGLYEQSNEDDNDEDLPQYCRKCNLWFDNFDPSYPFRCNCNPVTLSTGGTDTLNTIETGSIYSMHMNKDFRYYFQHPYSRFFIAYFVIFCNFFIFAEDPLSHSLRECSIPVLGNVISFLFTKYPPEVHWQLIKSSLCILAIILGLVVGKYFCHHFILRKLFRLKMFRDESGSWMIMLITTVLIGYFVSKLYNITLKMFHHDPGLYLVNSRIGISFASFMKIAACGTWMGDFFTAWMITDMMLQDNLYPEWAPGLRKFWHLHTTIRIVVFWSGALVIAALVITIILTDLICWDYINLGLISTTELSRAYVACAILFMDLLIVMQDWDFPHFVSDLNIKLPGMLRPSYTLNFCRKSVKFPATEIKISGKWFNYSIIIFVMMLDLNMWKNQIIYNPADFGQYVDPKTNQVHTVNETTVPERIDLEDPELSNYTVWTFEQRLTMHDSANHSLIEYDLVINSRYLGYSWFWKGSSVIPIALGFGFFFTLIYLYGRFPPKTDRSLGGRLKKRGRYKSSWRRERRDSQTRSRHMMVYDGQNHTSMVMPHDGLSVSSNNNHNNYTLEPCRPTAVFISNDTANPNHAMQGLMPSSQQPLLQPSVHDEYHQQQQQPQQISLLLPPPPPPPVSVSLQFVTSNQIDQSGRYLHSSSSPSSSSAADSSTPLFSGHSTPLSTTSTSSSSYHRLLPQFNTHLIWSSLLSALSVVGSSNKGRSASPKSPDRPLPPSTAVVGSEWLALGHSATAGDHQQQSQQPQMNSSRNCNADNPLPAQAAATIVTLPPFQPQSMLQFQTQFVQLPLSTQVRAT